MNSSLAKVSICLWFGQLLTSLKKSQAGFDAAMHKYSPHWRRISRRRGASVKSIVLKAVSAASGALWKNPLAW
jgi:hypothetical protein